MSPPRILVVNDEQIARENLEYILGKEGYEVVAVESGEQALEELEAGEFDQVLTDLRLHRVDGMQVLKRAKELSPEPDLQQRSLQMTRRQRRKFLTLEENEKEYIAWILEQVQGNRTRAAEILGIDRVSLWRKLKRYGLA
jgi:DNA-binding NtrC family response regulator